MEASLVMVSLGVFAGFRNRGLRTLLRRKKQCVDIIGAATATVVCFNCGKEKSQREFSKPVEEKRIFARCKECRDQNTQFWEQQEEEGKREELWIGTSLWQGRMNCSPWDQSWKLSWTALEDQTKCTGDEGVVDYEPETGDSHSTLMLCGV